MLSLLVALSASTISCVAAFPSNILPLRTRNALSARHGSSAVASLVSTSFAEVVDIEITIGGQSFLVELDLGSSDTWVVQTGVRCIDRADNSILPDCNYGNVTYDISPTFSKIPDQNFGVFYGAGIAAGILANETVTLAGITVQNQKVGIVNSATNQGDGLNSGLIGLAYPALTSAHPGESIDNTTFLYNRIPYLGLPFTMAAAGLIEPFFSMAIERTPFNVPTGPGGFFGLGEVVPVSHAAWTSTPVVFLNQIPLNVTANKTQLSYWALEVKSVTYGAGPNLTHFNLPASSTTPGSLTTNLTSFKAILDNGNPITILPDEVAEALNLLFDPPATPPAAGDYIWSVSCTATPPIFGLGIGRQTFWHDARDMIYNVGDGTCISSIGKTGDAPLLGVTANFIGLQFFKNVVGVFDFGKDEIRLAARV